MQSEGSGGAESTQWRAESTELWIDGEALQHHGLQEMPWHRHPRYALTDLCNEQRLEPAVSPRTKRWLDLRGRIWLQVCHCTAGTMIRLLLTASFKDIIKFLVEKEEEEKK